MLTDKSILEIKKFISLMDFEELNTFRNVLTREMEFRINTNERKIGEVYNR